ncbi:MAG: orotidine-5'-phosphate decarboxylase [Alphaproteobacteria bacterium]|jgi:orotidine-5'-phosphate decarboxylase|nr:orotidine-5'-phosphate decarboxylase [Alphaproteobacteria bacterium]
MPLSATAAPIEERLIVALDLPSVAEARAVVDEIGDAVRFYKIGMQLQFANGLQLAEQLVGEGKKVFLDAKLFDIDATIEKAVASVARMGASFLTVHGNEPTIRAAVRGRGAADLKILSVTVLTSLDHHDIQALGFACDVRELTLHRAKKAAEAGADGVIASGLEVAEIKQLQGQDLLIVTPGIRSAGVSANDQKRVVTPEMAILAGADYLVMGRQIVAATDRRAAARSAMAEMCAAFERRAA